MNSTSRQLSIDLIRIISTIAVVLVHVVAHSYFLLSDIGYKNWVISSSLGWLSVWAVPVFVMVSGYLLIGRPINSKVFFYRRASKIIIPLLFWNIFYYIFFHWQGGGSTSEFFYQLYHSGTYGHLYFLNVMVGLYLITPLISKYIIKINLNITVPLLIGLSVLYYFGFCFWGFPKADNIFTLFLPYLGYYLSGYWVKQWSGRLNFISLFILIFFLLSIYLTRKLVFIFNTHEQDTILVSNLSLPVATMAVIIFYRLVSLPNHFLSKHLPKLSDLTLGVYLIHIFWLEVLKIIPMDNYWLWFPSLFSLTLVLSFSSVYLLKKIPLFRRIV